MKKLFTMVAMAFMAVCVNAQSYELTGTTIDNDTYNAIIAAAEDNAVEVILPAGEISIALTGSEGAAASMTLPEGLSIKFTGASGDVKSVLSIKKSILFNGTHGYIRFENITLTDGGCQYLFNQAKEANVDEISFTNCEFKNFDRSLIRTQGSENITIKEFLVDNCIGTNLSSGNGYSVFYFGTATTTIDKLEIKNSTFDTTQRSFIEASKSAITNGITISDCTFYNNVADGRYLIDANGQSTNINLTNIILGKSYVDSAKGIRTAGTITNTNSLRTSDCIYKSNDIKELPAGDKTSTEIFTDPENHDFTLLIGDKIGDPRWYNPSAPSGVSSVKAEKANAASYNLGGQQVKSSAKGLVIKNGKKIAQ